MFKAIKLLGSSSPRTTPKKPEITAPTQTADAKNMASARFFLQKYRHIKQLPKAKSSDYGIILTSDNPKIDLAECKMPQDESVALLGNSGFRVVELACQLVAKQGIRTPQIYLMDFDAHVITIWQQVKAFFYHTPFDQSFYDKFKVLLITSQKLIVKAFGMSVENVIDYDVQSTKTLIDKNGFSLVKELIINAVLIRQDWENKESFIKLNRLLHRDHIKNTVVYASNILSLVNEIKASQIANNIALLKPKWSIHENFAPLLAHPTDVFITRDFTPSNILSNVTKLHSLQSSGFSLVGRRIMSPLGAIDFLHSEMQRSVITMLNNHGYGIDPTISALLPDLLLKMSGITEIIRNCFYEPSKYKQNCVFHFPFPKEETERFIQAIKHRFPALGVDAVWINETDQRIGLPMRLSISMKGIMQLVVPQIPSFLESNPELLAKHQRGGDWMTEGSGYSNILKAYKILFDKYHMSYAESDCMEETLCNLVKQDCEKRGIHVPLLETTQSQFLPNPNDDDQTLFVLSTPKQAAQEIVNYFNQMEANSAQLIEIPDATGTTLCVNNSILLSPQFLEKMEETIQNYPEEVKNAYVAKAFPGGIANSSERIGLRR